MSTSPILTIGAPGFDVDQLVAELRGVRVGGRDPIPTLDELLESFPEGLFNIERSSREG